MRTDQEIRKDVVDELKWQPFLKSSTINVAVKNGIVTLSGVVDAFSKKITAETAAKKVAGVKAIAEDVQISVSDVCYKNDTELAEAIDRTLEWHSAIPKGNIKVTVTNGNVAVEGELDWEYQRASVIKAIQNIKGIRSVINLLVLKPRISSFDLEQKIAEAFHRNAGIDAANVHAVIDGNTVTLTGRVRSSYESEDAENAAWAAPGVFHVKNELYVGDSKYAL